MSEEGQRLPSRSASRTGRYQLDFDVEVPFTPALGGLVPMRRPARITRTGASVFAGALVDTGASDSLFDGHLARELGLTAADADAVIPVAGRRGLAGFVARVHRVTMRVGGPHRFVRLAPVAGFVDAGVGPSVNVLGRRGFLDRVRFGIDGTMLPPQFYLGLPR